MTHIAAQQARAAMAARKFDRAEAILREAIESQGWNPDLTCEFAILRTLAGKEGEALRLLTEAAGGERYDLLTEILFEHAFCALQIQPNNLDLANIVESLRPAYKKDPSELGLTLSACLIVKNEASNLERCLSSVKDVVDQIVVVDTGSTDGTVAIAEQFGATIGHFEWCNDFAAARNESLKLATGHWALWIDADEELTPKAAEAIQRAIIRPQFAGFDIEIVNYTDERDQGSEFVHWGSRLFRNARGTHFEGRVHEQVVFGEEIGDRPRCRLEGVKILHHGYRPQVMTERSKITRTVTMLEQEVRENPTDAFQWFNLANALAIGNRMNEAEHAARRCVHLMPEDAEYGRLVYQILAHSLSAQDRFEESLAACSEAEIRGFGSLLIDFERAATLMKAERTPEALDSIDRCISAEWPSGLAGDYTVYTHKRFVLRGQILAVLGRHQEALDMFDRALDVDPGFPTCLYSRAATLEKMGRLIEAQAGFRAAVDDASTHVISLKGLGRIHTALGQHRDAADAFSGAWHAAPEDFEAWVGWANACQAWGHIPALVAAYEAFARLHEPSVDILINWGRALDAAGQAERALHCFTEAMKREPTNANAYFNCGDLLYRMGNAQDAAHLYEAGLRYDPANPDGWFTLGNAFAQVGLTENAVKSYQQALAINPQHQKAQHNLAVVLSPEFVTN